MKPVIGIALDQVQDIHMHASRGVPDQLILGTTKPIFDAVRAAGGVPVGLGGATTLEEALDDCARLDGLIVPGGPDIFPGTYGKPISPTNSMLCIEKDVADVCYIRAMVQLGRPMLGICRGMQLMNALLGGTLVEDIPTCTASQLVHFSPVVPAWLPTHQVELLPGELADALGKAPVMVNSFHHQCVESPAPGLSVAARSPDGLVEALEGGTPYVLGIQWHPEYLFEKFPGQLEIFRLFIEKGRKYGASNQN